MEFVEFKGKTLDEALMQASVEFGCASTDLEYTILNEGSQGFLGLIGSKPCVISAKKKNTFTDDVREYLENLFKAMDIQAEINLDFDDTNNVLNIDLEGPEMGILIGKRGQTLDALQYLISLAVNKKSDSYIRVKVDTENYRARRKETLENLAKNIAFKVKRTKRSFALEPMNPYERRIIHATLQNDKYVATRSEGDEPYRKVIIYLKKYDKNNK
jgi:spoIIIJ-associated protein